MLAAHRGLPPRPFARPNKIVETAICAEGGLLPGPACPAMRLERFVAGTQPTRRDDTHLRVAVDTALGCRAPAGYPAERTTERVFRVLPPGAEAWAVAAGMPQLPRRVCPLDAAGGQRPSISDQGISAPATGPQPPAGVPALLSPAAGAVFAISPGIPRERQRIALAAQSGGDASRLTIYLDGQPLVALAGPPYRAFWQLAPGAHRAWVEAQDEAGTVRRSAEVEFVVTQQP
jgi:hypothetical protein